MTNIELIKELLATVENHGVLPVYIDAGMIRDYKKKATILLKMLYAR